MASYQDQKEELVTRLNRIEGQVRGIKKMIKKEKYCVDVLTQIAASKGALNKVARNILENHIHGCVQEAIGNDNGEEMIDELMEVIDKFTN
ncbi:metal-sensitive transcriptional regulator [Halanaerobaculum tunisiense]